MGDYEDWDLGAQALAALARATDMGVSGVTFRELPKGYILVVPEPYGASSFPIMVTRPWRDQIPVEIAEAIEQEEVENAVPGSL
jgi:hypothetical protein